eukprot:34589-Hanusia_phi.AAC.2
MCHNPSTAHTSDDATEALVFALLAEIVARCSSDVCVEGLTQEPSGRSKLVSARASHKSLLPT